MNYLGNFKSKSTFITIAFLSLFSQSSPALARPEGVPSRACSEVSTLTPGTLCFVKHENLGGKANAHGSPVNGEITIQPQSSFYVVDSVKYEELSKGGNGTVRPRILARGATISISEGYNRKLEEVNRIINELDAQVSGTFGPLSAEAKNKLQFLREKRDEYSTYYSNSISAGENAPTTQYSWSASSRSCGTLGLDTCGSWVNFNLYEIRRYLGDPLAEYNKIVAPAVNEARSAVIRASSNSNPNPSPPTGPGIPPVGMQGLPSGQPMTQCACWGPNPPQFANESRCASGLVQVSACPALPFCAPGHPQYGYVCR